jgi:hypothetical protein
MMLHILKKAWEPVQLCFGRGLLVKSLQRSSTRSPARTLAHVGVLEG